jgi:dGTP triphosphohydrolase
MAENHSKSEASKYSAAPILYSKFHIRQNPNGERADSNFVLDGNKVRPQIPSYDSSTDKYLQTYFQNKKTESKKLKAKKLLENIKAARAKKQASFHERQIMALSKKLANRVKLSSSDTTDMLYKRKSVHLPELKNKSLLADLFNQKVFTDSRTERNKIKVIFAEKYPELKLQTTKASEKKKAIAPISKEQFMETLKKAMKGI